MDSLNGQGGNGTTGRGVLEYVRDTATSQLSNQKARATDGLGSLARAVRQSTQSLRDNQQDTAAQYIERAADRIEEFSSRLRDRELGDLMRDAEQFARRQPAVFIGAAFLVGVLAARFLKSSSSEDDYRNQLPTRKTPPESRRTSAEDWSRPQSAQPVTGGF